MNIKTLPWIVWIIVAGIALAATGRHPYSFYTMTRFVVSAASVLMVVIATKEKWPVQIWSIGFIGLAILFNPIAPFYLDRETWHTYDIGAGLFFIAHLVVVRIGLSKIRAELSGRGQQGSKR